MPSNIEIRLTKNGPNRRPYGEIRVSKKVSVKDLLIAQKVVVTEGFVALKIRPCPTCTSGGDFDVVHEFENLLTVNPDIISLQVDPSTYQTPA